jgi:hypothetical protein
VLESRSGKKKIIKEVFLSKTSGKIAKRDLRYVKDNLRSLGSDDSRPYDDIAEVTSYFSEFAASEGRAFDSFF